MRHSARHAHRATARPQRVPRASLCTHTPRMCPSDTENISPGVIMGVAKELRKLCNEPLDGIKVVLNEEEVTDITAEIAGPGAPSIITHTPAQRYSRRVTPHGPLGALLVRVHAVYWWRIQDQACAAVGLPAGPTQGCAPPPHQATTLAAGPKDQGLTKATALLPLRQATSSRRSSIRTSPRRARSA